jgi:hypothetical protein
MKDAVTAPRVSRAAVRDLRYKKCRWRVDCTRLLGAVTLGPKHLKKPAIWRALK